ncbi:MAG: MFS transporter [Thermosynechococcaceae cyanobacterium]
MVTSGPQPTSGGFQALMKNKGFVILWSGQIVSQLADKIFLLLLVELVAIYAAPQLFGYSMENSMRSAIMITNTLPAVLFGSAAGLFVDRWSKKQILWTTTLGRGALVLLIPLFPEKQVIWIFLVAFFESILTQFFAPAEQAAIPVVVKPQLLMPAIALFTTTMMGSLVVGFASGSFLIQWASQWGGVKLGGAFLVGGLYLISAGLLVTLQMHEKQETHTAALNPWSDLKLGFQYLRKNRLLGNAMLQLTVVYCVFAALAILAFPLAAKIGFTEKSEVGFLLAAAGVGLVQGAGILGQWGKRFHHLPLPLIGFIGMGSVLMIFSLLRTALNDDPNTISIGLGLGLSFLLGLGASLVGVPMQTLIQEQTPPDMRGKVFGFQNNMVNIALCFPLAITGLLIDLVDTDPEQALRKVLIGMGISVIVAGVWTWRSTHKVLEDAI